MNDDWLNMSMADFLNLSDDEREAVSAGLHARDKAYALRLLLAYMTDDPDGACLTDREIGGTHGDGIFTVSGCATCADPMEELVRIAGQALVNWLGEDAAIALVTRELADCLDRVADSADEI
jgi:hypothetical protein